MQKRGYSLFCLSEIYKMYMYKALRIYQTVKNVKFLLTP